jgi:hypothetical protein
MVDGGLSMAGSPLWRWGEVDKGSDVVVEAIVGEVVAFRYVCGVVLEVGCEVLKLSGGLLRDYSS